jgi:hypothetical protein
MSFLFKGLEGVQSTGEGFGSATGNLKSRDLFFPKTMGKRWWLLGLAKCADFRFPSVDGK